LDVVDGIEDVLDVPLTLARVQLAGGLLGLAVSQRS
jgi:hypothetical protein